MASKTDICNLCLTRLGSDNILSIDDDTKRAQTLKAIYDTIRDIVLADHPWNFAVTRATLARLSAAPDFGYSYAYQVPSDCLRMLGLVNSSTANVDPSLEYKIENGQLLTNATTAPVKYISRVTVEGLFSPVFCSALAFRLAAEVAYKITSNAALKTEIMKEYQLELGKAKGVDAQEDTPEVYETETWATARL